MTRPLKLRAIALAVASCFAPALMLAPNAWANPTGPTVVNGTVNFVTNGNTLNITNTPGSIINWQQFNIDQNELTRFLQQNSQSTVLNRITGQDPSQIFGQLQSNGKVLLVNPNGVVFGANASVDVFGLVASSLNLTDTDFLANRYYFNSGSRNAGAASVLNQGAITTPAGGSVYLVGGSVTNSGIITSPQGQVLLAAGNAVTLADTATPALNVTLSATNNQAVNLGTISAAGGSIDIYGALVSQQGALNADSASVDAQGRITLKATDTTTVSGSISATNNQGAGGNVQVLGDKVTLTTSASIDASGAAQGGTVLVGGDWQGKNAAVQNASITDVHAGASIKADATDAGNGGKVVVWATDKTTFDGSISAKGGVNSGDGGNVETSGHTLVAAGSVNTLAPKGKAGNWLLDPAGFCLYVVNITECSVNGYDAGTSNYATTALDSQLVASNVTWNASNFIALLPNGGSYTVSGSVPGGRSLTLQAPMIAVSSFQSAQATRAYLDFGNVALNFDASSIYGTAPLASETGTLFMMQTDLSSNASQTFNASKRVQVGTNLTGGGSSILMNNAAGTQSFTSSDGMDFVASDIHATKVASSGAQTITATNAMTFRAGSAGTDNAVTLSATNPAAQQSISAGSMQLSAGTSGVRNKAGLYSAGTQTITVTGTGNALTLTGGGSGPSDVDNTAEIQHSGTTAGSQTIALTGVGATLLMTGGAGSGMTGATNSCGTACDGKVSGNKAQILNYFGDQTFDFQLGGFLALAGGSVGNDNRSYIINFAKAGTQLVGSSSGASNAPTVALMGGASGGTRVSISGLTFLDNGVLIRSDASQSVVAKDIVIAAAKQTGATGPLVSTAGLFLNAGSGTQTIQATNSISLWGGDTKTSYPVNSYAYINSLGTGGQNITANSLKMYGGASGSNNYAIVRASAGLQNITLNGTAPTLWMEAGGTSASDFGDGVYIYHASNTGTAPGSQTITLNGAGANITMKGGKGTGTGALDGACMNVSGGDTSLCAVSYNAAEISNVATGTQNITFSQPGGSLAMTGGSVGTDNFAGINGSTALNITGNPDIVLTAGASGGVPLYLPGSKVPGISEPLWNAAFIAGGAVTSVAAHNVTMDARTAAAGSVSAAGIAGATGLVFSATGNVDMYGGNGAPVSARASAANAGHTDTMATAVMLGAITGNANILVGGNLNVNGGSGSAGVALVGDLSGSGAAINVTAQGSASFNGNVGGVYFNAVPGVGVAAAATQSTFNITAPYIQFAGGLYSDPMTDINAYATGSYAANTAKGGYLEFAPGAKWTYSASASAGSPAPTSALDFAATQRLVLGAGTVFDQPSRSTAMSTDWDYLKVNLRAPTVENQGASAQLVAYKDATGGYGGDLGIYANTYVGQPVTVNVDFLDVGPFYDSKAQVPMAGQVLLGTATCKAPDWCLNSGDESRYGTGSYRGLGVESYRDLNGTAGAGNITVVSAFSLPGTGLGLYADGLITVNGAIATGQELAMTSGYSNATSRGITINQTLSSLGDVRLDTNGDIRLAAPIQSNGKVRIRLDPTCTSCTASVPTSFISTAGANAITAYGGGYISSRWGNTGQMDLGGLAATGPLTAAQAQAQSSMFSSVAIASKAWVNSRTYLLASAATLPVSIAAAVDPCVTNPLLCAATPAAVTQTVTPAVGTSVSSSAAQAQVSYDAKLKVEDSKPTEVKAEAVAAVAKVEAAPEVKADSEPVASAVAAPTAGKAVLSEAKAADASKSSTELKTESKQAATEAKAIAVEAKAATAVATTAVVAAKAAVAEVKKADTAVKAADAVIRKADAVVKQADADVKAAKTPEQKAQAETRKVTAEAQRSEAQGKRADAEAKKPEVEAKLAVAQSKQAEAQSKEARSASKQAESEAKQAVAEAKEATTPELKVAAERKADDKRIEAIQYKAQAEVKQSKSEVKLAQADAHQAKAEAKKTEAQAHQADAEAKKAELKSGPQAKAVVQAKRTEAEVKQKLADAKNADADAKLANSERKQQESRSEVARVFGRNAGQVPYAKLAEVAAIRHEAKADILQGALDMLQQTPNAADLPACGAGADACIPSAASMAESAGKFAAQMANISLPQPATAFVPEIRRKVAVVIGINKYADSQIPALETAVPDAKAIATALKDKLGYEVRMVEDATRADIVKSLNAVAREVGPNDSVTVYYAGHGYLDEQAGRKTGYWIPSDASVNSAQKWINNNDIAKLLKNIPAKQVMLVSDSCYSGALVESRSSVAAKSPQEILKQRSVAMMSSGGEEPVSDEGREGHSIFAWNLLKAIDKVENYQTGATLFESIREGVVQDYPQVPQYGASTAAGHTAGGDYLLEKRSYK